MAKKNVDIIKDVDGKSIVVINDLCFKGRRSVDWDVVEDCLKEYIGECAEITHRNIKQMQNLAGIGMIHVSQYLFMIITWNWLGIMCL